MFRKLTNSLMSPKEVAKYHNEPFWKTLLFFLVLLVFMMVPTVLNLSTTSLLSGNTEKEIKKAFYNEDIPFVIEDGTLKNVNDDHDYVYVNQNIANLKFIFTENIDNFKDQLDVIGIAFCNDGVYVRMSVVKEKVFEYKDAAYLRNIDFTDKDKINGIEFWDNMFYIADSILNDIKPMYVTTYSLYYLFYWSIWMLFFMLIIALFAKLRMGKYLSFGRIYKVSVYNLAPFIVCLVFATLFNWHFLVYIGYIIAAIYNIITVNELMKDLYLKRKEGE